MMPRMLELIILGFIQGLAEWLPVSSEGLIVLVRHRFFAAASLEESIATALFLHLGTVLAAIVYFRKDLVGILRDARARGPGVGESKKILWFLGTATLISGFLGLALLKGLLFLGKNAAASGRGISILVGGCLLITGILQLRTRSMGDRRSTGLRSSDGVILGIAQGMAALPGLSRSGFTVATLLLRGFEKETALRLSFLMSIPIVLAGNVLLQVNDIRFSLSGLAGLTAAFLSGLATIHILLLAARRLNFGIFLLIFGGLIILSTLV